MATYQVTMPGGNVISQDLPDGMSDQMVKAAFLKHYQAAGFSSVGNIVDQSPQSQAPTPDIAPQAPDVPPPGTPNPLGYYQGEIRPYTPSLSETIQNKLAGYATPVMGDLWGNKLAQAVTEGLNTFTPVGALTAANDAGREFFPAMHQGDYGTAGLSLASLGIAALPGGAKEGSAKRALDDIAPKWLKDAMREYPTAPRSEWYGDADFAQRGGQIVNMTPDEFLSHAKPLQMDDITRDNIDDLKAHIEAGRTLDPLMIGSGKAGHDGRHRAYAAKELGIQSVPVINYPLR